MSHQLAPVDTVEVQSYDDAPQAERGETAFRELVDDGSLTVQRVSIPSGRDEAAHYHDADTYIYHLGGVARVTFRGADGEERVEEFSEGDMLTIPAYVVHQPSSVGDEPVETVALRAGGDVETEYV